MSICAVLAEVTLLLLLKVLANLCLIVVVRNVKHLVLYFYRQLLSNKNNVIKNRFSVLILSDFQSKMLILTSSFRLNSASP